MGRFAIVVAIFFCLVFPGASRSQPRPGDKAAAGVVKSQSVGSGWGFYSSLSKFNSTAKAGASAASHATQSMWRHLPSKKAVVDLAAAGAGEAKSLLDRIRQKLPEIQSYSHWIKSGAASYALVDLRVAIKNGWVLIPREREWWEQFAVTTGVVGITVGWASFGCAIVATPAGPAFIALASGACGVVASDLGVELVKVGYERFAEDMPSDSALKAGQIAGTVFGVIGAGKAIDWVRYWHFKDYAGYAYAARSITRRNLELLRRSSYDVDHIIPVKCGWALGLSPQLIGSLGNLHALPAWINRSIGAKGC